MPSASATMPAASPPYEPSGSELECCAPTRVKRTPPASVLPALVAALRLPLVDAVLAHEPVADLDHRDDGRAVLLLQLDEVLDVVAVAVCDRDHVDALRRLLVVRAFRVVRQERVDVDPRPAVRVEAKRSVSEPGEFHGPESNGAGSSGAAANLSRDGLSLARARHRIRRSARRRRRSPRPRLLARPRRPPGGRRLRVRRHQRRARGRRRPRGASRHRSRSSCSCSARPSARAHRWAATSPCSPSASIVMALLCYAVPGFLWVLEPLRSVRTARPTPRAARA